MPFCDRMNQLFMSGGKKGRAANIVQMSDEINFYLE